MANLLVWPILCATHSDQSFFQLTVWDVTILIHVHLFKSPQQVSFFTLLFTFEDFTKVIKVKFWRRGSPVFMERCIGGVSTSLLKSLGKNRKGKQIKTSGLRLPSGLRLSHTIITLLLHKNVYLTLFSDLTTTLIAVSQQSYHDTTVVSMIYSSNLI